MRQDVGKTLNLSLLELLRRACIHSDLEAWAAFQQGLEETVLTWLHEHPGSEAACRVQSESHFVALAFERLWQATIQGQVTCETLTGVLVYLRASLNVAILQTMRHSSRPGVVSRPWPDVEDCPDRSSSWDRLQARLSDQRERQLAYLLYHCGLGPKEIVQCCPQQWSDVHEVARVRRIIVVRLMKGLSCEGQTLV